MLDTQSILVLPKCVGKLASILTLPTCWLRCLHSALWFRHEADNLRTLLSTEILPNLLLRLPEAVEPTGRTGSVWGHGILNFFFTQENPDCNGILFYGTSILSVEKRWVNPDAASSTEPEPHSLYLPESPAYHRSRQSCLCGQIPQQGTRQLESSH